MIRKVATTALLLAGFAAQAVPIYTLTPVPSGAAVETRPTGLNDAGDIAGVTIGAAGAEKSFMWTGGVFSVIPNLGSGDFGAARGITNSGTVAGISCTQPSSSGCYPLHSYLYSGGQLTDFSSYVGTYVHAIDINHNGVVVGVASGPYGSGVFLFDSTTSTTSWVPGMGGDSSWAEGINNLGHVAGYQRISPGGPYRAFTYIGSVLTNLGTLGGSSYATDINDAGTVAGFAEIAAGGPRHAFVYSGGTMTDIHPASGFNETLAFDISADGAAIVGVGFDNNGEKRAVAWFNGTFVDLNTVIPAGSGWLLQSAGFLNASGQIAGYGVNEGAIRTFRLEPDAAVPEPAALSSVIAGGLLLVLLGRRRSAAGPPPPDESVS